MSKTVSEYPIERVDLALERLLPCNSPAAFTCELSALADELEWGELPPGELRRDGDPIRRFVWGLFTRLKEYEGPANRSSRSGPLTWAEKYLILKALETRSGEAAVVRKGPPTDPAYLAKLLMRTEADIKEALFKLGPNKGNPGFGLR